jgi:hypothetical protein
MIDRSQNVGPAGIIMGNLAPGIPVRDGLDATLGHQLQPIPEGWFQGQGTAKELLAGIVAIDVGVIKGGNAQV